jgi:hypothetical protein
MINLYRTKLSLSNHFIQPKNSGSPSPMHPAQQAIMMIFFPVLRSMTSEERSKTLAYSNNPYSEA